MGKRRTSGGQAHRRRGIGVAIVAAMVLALAAVLSPAAALAEDASSTESVPMYRLYNRWSGEHLFTTNEQEYSDLAKLGWQQEGVAWQAPTQGDAVYRLYNRWSGDHFYTANKSEYDSLGSIGWNKEDVAFYSVPTGTEGATPIYRLYNPWLQAGTHLFTTNYQEYQELQVPGWRGEGIAFYGVKQEEPTPTPTPDPDNPDTPSGDTHHVRFVTDEAGEERVLSEYDAKDGATMSKPQTDPTRDGYEFRGWNTKDDGSATAWGEGVACTEDITWHAVWAPVAPAEKTEDGQTTSGLRYDDGVKAVEGGASADGTSATVSADEARGVEAGDIVVLNADDPDNLKAIKVTKVSGEGGEARIEGTVPDITEVFQDAHIEGKAAMSADNLILADGITAENVGTELATSDDSTTVLPKVKLTVNFEGGVEKTPKEWSEFFPGSDFAARHSSSLSIKGTYVATVSGYIEWLGDLDQGVVQDGSGLALHVNRTETLDSSITGQGKIHLALMQAAPGVFVDIDIAFQADGTVKLVATQQDMMGFKLSLQDGVDFMKSHSGSTTFEAGISGKAGMSLYAHAGLGNMAMLSGEGNLGVQASTNIKNRSTGLICQDINANLYLNFHFDAGLKTMLPFIKKAEIQLDYIVWDEKDSVWKTSVHLEDGKEVSRCTWETYSVEFRDPIKSSNNTSVSIGRGEKIMPSAPTAPAHDNWTFVRWERTDSNGAGESLDDGTTLGESSRTYEAVYTRTRSLGKGCSVEEDTRGNLRVYPTDGKSGTMARVGSLSYFAGVKSITIDKGVKASGNSDGLFSNLGSLASLDANNLDTSAAYTMKNLFYDDYALKDLSGVSSWDVAGVTDLTQAFYQCNSLEDISGLANWDVAGVTDMDQLFYWCNALVSLHGLENWDVASVSEVDGLFYVCSSLRDISAVSNWVTSKFASTNSMFYGCSVLSDLSPLAKWDLSSVTSTEEMFRDCSRLTNLRGLENWDVQSVSDMSVMFYDCTRLNDISALSAWKTPLLTNMSSMFGRDTRLTSLNGLAWDVSGVTNMSGLFSDCSYISDFSALANWNVARVTTMNDMFSGCTRMENTDMLANWQINSLTNMGGMFDGCTKLASVEGLRNWNVKNIMSSNYPNCHRMFSGCTNLYDLSPLEGWADKVPEAGVDPSHVSMFQNCPGTVPSWYHEPVSTTTDSLATADDAAAEAVVDELQAA